MFSLPLLSSNTVSGFCTGTVSAPSTYSKCLTQRKHLLNTYGINEGEKNPVPRKKPIQMPNSQEIRIFLEAHLLMASEVIVPFSLLFFFHLENCHLTSLNRLRISSWFTKLEMLLMIC